MCMYSIKSYCSFNGVRSKKVIISMTTIINRLQVPQQILRPRKEFYGRIELKMSYSIEKEHFTVNVLRAKELLNLGTRGVSCDPFIKWYVPLALYGYLQLCILLSLLAFYPVLSVCFSSNLSWVQLESIYCTFQVFLFVDKFVPYVVQFHL